MSPNEPKTSFFGQNPVFPAKIDEDQVFRLKSTETSFFTGQKPVFPAKIDQNHFSWPNETKTKQVFSAKINQNHIV